MTISSQDQAILHLEQQMSQIPLEALDNYKLVKSEAGYSLKALSWADRVVRFFIPSRYDSAENVIQVVQAMKVSFHSDADTLAYAKITRGLLQLLPKQTKANTPSFVARQKIAELHGSLKKLESEDFSKVLKAIEEMPQQIKTVASSEVMFIAQQALDKLQLPKNIVRLRGHENLQKARDEVVSCLHKRLLESPTNYSLNEVYRTLRTIDRFDARFGTQQASKVDEIRAFPELLYKVKYQEEEKQLVQLANELLKKPFIVAKGFQGRITKYRGEVGEEHYDSFQQMPHFQALIQQINHDLMNPIKSASFVEKTQVSVRTLQALPQEKFVLPDFSKYGQKGDEAKRLVQKWAALLPNYYSAIKTFQREKKLDQILVGGVSLGVLPTIAAEFDPDAEGSYKVALLAEALLQKAKEQLPNMATEKLEKIVAEALCLACGDLNPVGQCNFLIEGINELQPSGAQTRPLTFIQQPPDLQPANRLQFEFQKDGRCKVMLAMAYLRGEEPVEIISKMEKSLHHPKDDWKGTVELQRKIA